MIVSRTPFRISFFGGGTDYPDWYREHSGAVVGTAIDKYCYISVRHLPPFFDHRHRIVYSETENVRDLSEIKHPAVREILKDYNVTKGLEIHHDGDLPARSGLGSSSSFVVGLMNALSAMNGQRMRQADLATGAIRIEQENIGEVVGDQDQIWAAYGGLNRIDFAQDRSFSVSPLILPADRRKELESGLLMFFTGITRFAPAVAEKKVANFQSRASELMRLREMVDQACEILENEGRLVEEFGKLLSESWGLKRGLADGVSNDRIDQIYDAAISAGALGGKLLGAGGGGFVVFAVTPDKRAAVIKRLRDLIFVSTKIGAEGSKIIVYNP